LQNFETTQNDQTYDQTTRKTTPRSQRTRKNKHKIKYDKAINSESILSPDHVFPVDLDGVTFLSGWHFIAYNRALIIDNNNFMDQVIKAKKPQAHKKLATSIQDQMSPNRIKYEQDQLEDFLLAKFQQHPRYNSEILNNLNPGYDLDDDYWGIGNDKFGKNTWGLMLSKLVQITTGPKANRIRTFGHRKSDTPDSPSVRQSLNLTSSPILPDQDIEQAPPSTSDSQEYTLHEPTKIDAPKQANNKFYAPSETYTTPPSNQSNATPSESAPDISLPSTSDPRTHVSESLMTQDSELTQPKTTATPSGSAPEPHSEQSLSKLNVSNISFSSMPIPSSNASNTNNGPNFDLTLEGTTLSSIPVPPLDSSKNTTLNNSIGSAPAPTPNNEISPSLTIPSPPPTNTSITDPKVKVINFLGQFKHEWQMPPLDTKIIIMGDSNISRITKSANPQVTLASYPGAKICNFVEILTNVEPPNFQVKTLILNIGLNNRTNKDETNRGQLKKMINQARRAFPNTNIYVPTINFSSKLNTSQTAALQTLNRHISNMSQAKPLPVFPGIFQTAPNDDKHIHWSETTANRILRHWLQYLN
jgi:predicted NAD-dependent protein-ADP-ribosyltransferase YbiA (DUF1768 family)